jgi:hypothetical protein
MRTDAQGSRARERGTRRTRQFRYGYPLLSRSFHCSTIEQLERRRGALALNSPLRLPLAAMSRHRTAQPNCLGVGYSARRVLGGRGCSRVGGFVSGSMGLAGRRRLISRGSGAAGDRAARPLRLAASIMGFQALAVGLVLAVARWTVARFGEGVRVQGLGVPGRLIASFRTGQRLEQIGAQLGRGELDQAGGVRPPADRAPAPYTLSLTTDPGSPKTRPEARSGAGCIEAARGRGPNVDPARPGSGVWVARKSAFLAAEARRAEQAVVQNRVRVIGGHRAFDLARTVKLGLVAR